MISFIFFFLASVIFTYFLNYFFKKKKIFLDNISYSKHKKFTQELNVPFSGGFLFIFFITFFLNGLSLINIFIFFSIFLLGVFSDLNKITSPIVRIFFQSFLIIFYILNNDIFVSETRIDFLDSFIVQYKIFAVFFTFFCVIVLINGTNFIDGVNNLASGTFFIAILNIVFLTYFIELNSNDLHIKLLILLSVFMIFNFFSLSFLGDSGCYILSFFIGFYLIDFYNVNRSYLSPYYILLLLWYPAFENLFSIIRRIFFEKKNVKKADNLHLHHLIYKKITKKFGKFKFSNSLAGILINIFNLIIIIPGNFYYSKTNILLVLVLIGVFSYISIYLYLRSRI